MPIRSFKGVYPFRLSTTSFIYPAGYAENVRRLAPFVDEIELLFFESDPAALPTATEIRELESLASEALISYNIHLPLDIRLGSPIAASRNHAVDTVNRVADLTAPLAPTTLTVHLDFCGDGTVNDHVSDWQDRTAGSLERICQRGILPEQFTVENLDYPFSWAAPLVVTFGMKVCIDVGHLLAMGADTEAHFDDFMEMADIVHLYGADGGHVHGPLTRMPASMAELVIPRLQRFTGTVSLEVFSLPDLQQSMACLAKLWQRFETRKGSRG